MFTLFFPFCECNSGCQASNRYKKKNITEVQDKTKNIHLDVNRLLVGVSAILIDYAVNDEAVRETDHM